MDKTNNGKPRLCYCLCWGATRHLPDETIPREDCLPDKYTDRQDGSPLHPTPVESIALPEEGSCKPFNDGFTTDGTTRAVAMAIAVGATHHLPERALSSNELLPEESLDNKNGSPNPPGERSCKPCYYGFATDGIARTVAIAVRATRPLPDETIPRKDYLPDKYTDTQDGSPLPRMMFAIDGVTDGITAIAEN